MKLAVCGATDLGLRRSNNEDTAAYWIPEDPAARARGVLLVVADGMGGSSAGEIASQLTVDTVLETFRHGEGELEEDLHLALLAANRVVHARGQHDPDLHGMGTTCSVVLLRDRDVYFAHVGDSRVYLIRQGVLRQITADHSLVQQLVQARQLTPEEARVDPRRNVVTRSVGVSNDIEVDVGQMDTPFADGDTLVLCTDGLHGLIEDDELAEIVAAAPHVDQACSDLIELARARGGYDNITVVLARCGDGVTDTPSVLWRAPERNLDPVQRAGAATGTLLAIHRSSASRALLESLTRAHAVAGRGIEGDRHSREGSHRQVLVVEAEVLDQLGLAPGAVREQLTVRGLMLDALGEGTRIRIGGARFEIAGPCAPCARMDEIRPGLRAALEGRRGRFVQVLETGDLAVGDTLTIET